MNNSAEAHECHPEAQPKDPVDKLVPAGFFAALRMTSTIIIVIAICSCGGGTKNAHKPREISAATVSRGAIDRKVMFTGNIVAEDAFEVFPRAAGKVSKKLLKEGDSVKRNQAILLIERDEVGYRFRQMPVVSLVDGLVGRITVDVGSTVDTSQPVAIVVRPGKMRVKLDIPERYLGAIQPGTDVQMLVDSLGSTPYDGKIVTSSPVIDEKTRTANVEVEVPNTDGRLRHGMFGKIDLVVERHPDTLVTPLNTISWEGDKQFIYLIQEGKIRRAEVKTGIRNHENAEILEGASAGDLVVAGNLIDLRDGEAVVVTNVERSSGDQPAAGESRSEGD